MSEPTPPPELMERLAHHLYIPKTDDCMDIVRCPDCWREAMYDASRMLRAITLALPEGVVLTRDGLARVVVTGATWCEPHANDCRWHRFDACNPAALYTLTRIEEQ